MDLLKNFSDAVVRTRANSKTPAPMSGVWVLTAPDGRTWTDDSPMECVQAEMRSRVPPQVALARIRRSLQDEYPDPQEQDAARYRLLLDGPHNFSVFVCGEDGCADDSISNAELTAALDVLLGA